MSCWCFSQNPCGWRDPVISDDMQQVLVNIYDLERAKELAIAATNWGWNINRYRGYQFDPDSNLIRYMRKIHSVRIGDI